MPIRILPASEKRKAKRGVTPGRSKTHWPKTPYKDYTKYKHSDLIKTSTGKTGKIVEKGSPGQEGRTHTKAMKRLNELQKLKSREGTRMTSGAQKKRKEHLQSGGYKAGGRANFRGGGRTTKKYVPDVAKSAQHPHSKLKTQKELKKITDSGAYKKSDYKGKTEMLGGKVYKAGGRAGYVIGGVAKGGLKGIKRLLHMVKTGKDIDKHGTKVNLDKVVKRLKKQGSPGIESYFESTGKHPKGKASGGRIGLQHGSRPRPSGPHTWVRSGGAVLKGKKVGIQIK